MTLITGTSGNDELNGTIGNDIIKGLAGNDTVFADSGNDDITGGQGDDFLEGGSGADIFRYASGDGNDIIADYGESNDEIDRLIITDPSMTSLNVIVKSGGGEFLPAELTLTFQGASGSIRLNSQIAGFGYGVEQVTFSDGVTWDKVALQNAYLSRAATDGNDTIYGFNTNDTLAGGLGDDALYGGDGGDLYLYARGDGNDYISDSGSLELGNDRLILSGEGLTSQNLVIKRPEFDTDDVQLTFKGVDGAIRIDAQAIGNGVGIERIRFSDGVTYDNLKLQKVYLERSVTKQSDEIYGFRSDDVIRGAGGDDVLFGEGGSDTYTYSKGDGNDTIIDRGTLNGEVDRLVISSGAGLTSTRARVKRMGDSNDLELSFSGVNGKFLLYGQAFTEEDGFQNNLGLEEVKFSDGVIWNRKTIQTAYLQQAGTSGNNNIIGFSSADLIVGGLGDDTLAGGRGADTFRYAVGDGFDRITDFQRGIDKLELVAASGAYQLIDLPSSMQVFVDFGGGKGVLVDNRAVGK